MNSIQNYFCVDLWAFAANRAECVVERVVLPEGVLWRAFREGSEQGWFLEAAMRGHVASGVLLESDDETCFWAHL